MRDILKKLLQPEAPVRMFCTVQAAATGGRYRVTDDLGRIFTVDGDSGYLSGDKVVVQSMRITGKGMRSAVVKTFQV